ncbi:MAG: 16S rRNA (guanine(527)-N(7))-methyltransferase RsmG [Bacteroidales bacterium]
MEKIVEYFPDLTESQMEKLAAMKDIYTVWNSAINVISRKDIANFYTNHVLHSLAIARVFSFGSGDVVLDLGTGGGFPGIPLAILFENASFLLIDSIAKKIKVVNDVAQKLRLRNVTALTGRAEQYRGSYRYVVTRAVAPLPEIVGLTRRGISGPVGSRGIIALKGGTLDEETDPYRGNITTWNISDFFPEPFFETKKIIWLKL